MHFFKSLFIKQRFFYLGIVTVLGFSLSYFFPVIFFIFKLMLLFIFVATLFDIFLLYWGKLVFADRIVPEKFSNGDTNTILVELKNNYSFSIAVNIIDELPEQFQKRDFFLKTKLNSYETKRIDYDLVPKSRGEYHFGYLHVFCSSILGLVARRYSFNHAKMVATYPSFKQLKSFDLITLSNYAQSYGLKQVRRLGHTMEFEQIKEYVLGDDFRTINWKATAKRNSLMVNQYQEEKSQPIYSIIDKGRVMQMPFNGLTLLDHSINTALAISHIVLKKQDKAGVLSFSKTIENAVIAERRQGQMQLILECLYNLKTNFFESDFSFVHSHIKHYVKQRSLLFFYTNFETLDALDRQLPYLKAIAKKHLLVVVFFKNIELQTVINQPSKSVQELYDKVIAEKFLFEKRLIVNALKRHGIYSILTTPENLTVDTINKYLAIKARGAF